MTPIRLRDGETLDSLIARFKREVKNIGVIEECKRREFFLKKSMKRKAKAKAAKLRKK